MSSGLLGELLRPKGPLMPPCARRGLCGPDCCGSPYLTDKSPSGRDRCAKLHTGCPGKHTQAAPGKRTSGLKEEHAFPEGLFSPGPAGQAGGPCPKRPTRDRTDTGNFLSHRAEAPGGGGTRSYGSPAGGAWEGLGQAGEGPFPAWEGGDLSEPVTLSPESSLSWGQSTRLGEGSSRGGGPAVFGPDC